MSGTLCSLRGRGFHAAQIYTCLMAEAKMQRSGCTRTSAVFN